MKILILSQYFWPENFKINELALELKKKHYVEVLTGVPNYPSGKIDKKFLKSKSKYSNYKGIRIHRSWEFLRGNGSKFRLFFNYLSFMISSIFKGLFLKKKFDLIFIFLPSPVLIGLSGIILSKFLNSKVRIWVLDLWPEVLSDLKIINSKIILRILDKIVNIIYLNSETIFVQSNSFKKIIKKKIKKKKLYILNSWNDQIPTRKRNNLIKKNSILYLGNIGYSQNFENLLDAAKILVKKKINFEIKIIGNGRRFYWLKKQIQDHKLNKQIKILNFKKSKSLGPHIHSSEFCFLSLKEGKGLNSTIPAKLQTYMKYSKPIIGVSDGEVKSIILNAKCGFVSKPGDSVSLAKNIENAFKLNSLKKIRLGKNSLKFSQKNYDKAKILSNFNKVFNKI